MLIEVVDQLNRLTGFNLSSNALRFSEKIGYDKHGNIAGHQRGGITNHNWTTGDGTSPNHTYASVDLMSYTSYTGNQVESITDSGSDALYTGAQDFKNNANTTDEYDYDANGNMTKDLNKEIVTISYNSLNLPDTFQLKDGHMLSYVYDASGRKEQVNRVTMVTSGITVPVGSSHSNIAVEVIL